MRIILAIGFMLWAPLALADASFDEWLTQLRKDAVADGISDTTLDAALKDVKLIERVIELDRSQPDQKILEPPTKELNLTSASQPLMVYDEA